VGGGVGDHLEEADGKLWVRLCGHPQPEALVQVGGLGQVLLHLGCGGGKGQGTGATEWSGKGQGGLSRQGAR
jgi:hypothetical protein